MVEAGGGSSLLYYDAEGHWSTPVVGTPAGSLPVGTPGNDTLVKFLRLWDEPIVWRVIGHDLETMKDADGGPLTGSITLLADRVIACMPFDAKEKVGGKTGRSTNGNNNWNVSNIRQWLNSTASAGEWYSPQHEYDQPPDSDKIYYKYKETAYADWAGFLNCATANEKSVLLKTTRTKWTAVNEEIEPCQDLMFLLTSTELNTVDSGGSSIKLNNNGVKIPYFVDKKTSIAYPSEQCVAKYKDIISDRTLSTDEAYSYWTATAAGSAAGDIQFTSVSILDHSGFARNDLNSAFSGSSGVRPACNISSSARVSIEPDADGCYTILT